MTSQKAILDQYRKIYPNDSLRDIAHRTGIHYSRTHRLLKGSEMKVSEYEAFHRAISIKGPSVAYAQNLFYACLNQFSPKKIQNLVSSLERSIINHQIVHKPIVEQFNYIQLKELA